VGVSRSFHEEITSAGPNSFPSREGKEQARISAERGKLVGYSIYLEWDASPSEFENEELMISRAWWAGWVRRDWA
jgi:hypothetical protein